MSDEVVAALEDAWNRIEAFCTDLGEPEWDLPTACPGWSVKDNVAHIVGTELMLAGEAVPPLAEGRERPHVQNDLGTLNEAWVEHFRSQAGALVLAELERISLVRLAALRDLDEEGWSKVGPTPIGQDTYREFMKLRAFDSWVHLQDIRRALDRPGDLSGPAAVHTRDHLLRLFPMIIGKRVAPPAGTTVRISITGEVPTERTIVMQERAGFIVPPEETTTTLVMDLATLTELVCGRVPPAELLASGRIAVEGDEEIGTAVAMRADVMI